MSGLHGAGRAIGQSPHHAVPDNQACIDFQGVQQRDDVKREVGNAIVSCAGALAMSGQINKDGIE